MEPIDAYKKENFTSAIINFDNQKYENPNIINIQGYATRKYVGLNLPEHFRLQGAGNLKNGLLCLIKLEDKFLLNLTKKNEVGEIELFQIFFDKEGNPIKPEHTEMVEKPDKFENIPKDSQRFARIIKYYENSVRKNELVLFGFDKEGKYYQTNIDLGVVGKEE